MTLDTGDEQLVRICFRVLNEVRRCLFSWDSNEWHTLVGGLKPDDLRAFNGSTSGFITTVTFTFPALSLLLLLSRGRRGSQKAESAREELTRHTLDHGNDMPSKLRLHIIGNPDKQMT